MKPSIILTMLLSFGAARAHAASGKFHGEVGGNPAIAWGSTQQGFDDKTVIVGGALSTNGWGIVRVNADGTLDTTFGTGGSVVTVPSQGGWAEAVASHTVSGIHQLTVVGYNGNFGMVARYLTNGALDTSFGSGGKVNTSFGTCTGLLYGSVVIDSSARTIAAGTCFNAGGNQDDFAIVRYLANGALDTSFGTSGGIHFNIKTGGASVDEITSLSVADDGTIFVGGSTINPGSDRHSLAFARVHANGTLDSTFGAGGIQVYNFGADERVARARVLDTGKIVVACNTGPSTISSHFSMFFIRMQANGALDTTFGANSNGAAFFHFDSTKDEGASAMAIDGSGRLLVGGGSSDSAGADMLVVRLHSDGTLDTSFNGSGHRTITFTTGEASAQEIAVTSTGEIIASGGSSIGAQPTYFATAGLTSTGALDSNYGL